MAQYNYMFACSNHRAVFMLSSTYKVNWSLFIKAERYVRVDYGYQIKYKCICNFYYIYLIWYWSSFYRYDPCFQCKIRKFNDRGVTVQVSGHIMGYIPSIHLADVPLRHPEKKFQFDEQLKCKVSLPRKNCIQSQHLLMTSQVYYNKKLY